MLARYGFNKRYLENQPKQNRITLTKDNSFLVFPFDIVLGYITSTENGIVNNNSIQVEDYSALERVFTGLENVLTTWTGSWTVEKKQDTDTFLTKTPKIGEHFRAFINQEQIGASFEPSTISADFLQEITDEVFTLHCYEDLPLNYLNKLFIIPGLKENKWLYISSSTKYYNKDKTLHHTEITLSSLNNKIAKSGGAVEQFVHRSAPGEGYTWPIVNQATGEITLDEIRLRDIPVNSIQVEYQGPAGFNTIYAYGRPTIQKTEGGITQGTFNDKIEASRLLLPFILETPIPSPLNTRPSAEGNWYAGLFKPTLWEDLKSWKDQFTATWDLSQRSQYEGILRSIDKKAVIEASNPIVQGQHDHILWDKAWKPTVNHEFNTAPDAMTGDKISLNGDYSIPQMFCHNIFATSWLEALPLAITQNIVWRSSGLPIIGGIANKVLGGVPFGWNDIAVRLQAPAVWLTLPTSLVEYGNALSPSNDDNCFIPLETFTGNRKDDATEFSGINATGSIMKMSYTHRFIKVIKGVSYIFDTKDLGQIHPAQALTIQTVDGKQQEVMTNIVHEDAQHIPVYLYWDATCIPTNRGNVPGYVVDVASHKALAKLVYRLTMFSNNFQVWTGTYQSRSLFTGSIRDWENTIKMSYWNTQDNKTISYPADIVAPKPPDTNYPQIKLDAVIRKYNQDNETSAQVLKNNGNVSSQGNVIIISGSIKKQMPTNGSFDTTPYGGITSFKNNYQKIQIALGERHYEIDVNDLITAGTIEIETGINQKEYFTAYLRADGIDYNQNGQASIDCIIKLLVNGNTIEFSLNSKITYLDFRSTLTVGSHDHLPDLRSMSNFLSIPTFEITDALAVPKAIE